jgi:putative aldouronate transport system permease protein
MIIRTMGEKILDNINYVLLVIIVILTAFPLVHLLAIAFNEGSDTARGGITFYPRKFTFVNFSSIIQDPLILNAYKITILRTVIGTFLSVLITALVAYGLSERKLPFRSPILVYFLITMFFSGGIIPVFLNLRYLGLINTFWVYVIPGIFVIWNMIVMKTFFQEIPEELKESMRMDGATELFMFYKLIIPISMPLFAAISLFVAVSHWNDWFTGAFFVFKQNLVPVQTYLQSLMNREMADFIGQNLNVKMASQMSSGRNLNDYSTISSLSLKVAGVVVGTLPILLVYPFLQKYFVKGVMIGSIKG